MNAPYAYRWSALVAGFGLIVGLGCGSDGATEPAPANIVGTWNASTIDVSGIDYAAQGMTLRFTFNSNGSYSYNVVNDLLGFCDFGVNNCNESGVFLAASGQLTFDPDTEWEQTLNYSVTDSTLRIFGTIWGFPIDATFQKQ